MADQSETWGNLQNVYGLSASDVQSLKSAGYDPNRASSLLQASIGSQITSTGGSYGNYQPISVSTIGGSGLSPSTLVKLASALGGGGGAQGGGTPMLPVGAVDPSQMMVNLGARALNERAVYPPTPGAADPTSGVSSGIGQTGATGATPTTMSADVPTARDVGLKGKNLGPWATTPGIFTQARALQPSTPTGTSPFAPTPQATGVQIGQPQPWATAPPAPGINLQGVPGMMGGGGMPGMGVQQGQPAMMGAGPGTGAVNAQTALAITPPPSPLNLSGQGAPTPSPRPQGPPAAPSVPPIKRFADGGIVTQPTVALLGEEGPEAVLPLGKKRKQTEQPAAMPQTQYGKGSTTQSATSDTQGDSDSTGQQQQQQTGTPQQIPNISNLARGGAAGTPAAGGGYSGDGYYVGGSPAPGQSGYIYPNKAAATAAGDIGAGPGGAASGGMISPQMGSTIGGAIGSIGSALQSAFSNVPSWKMQASAIPDPTSFTRQEQPQYNFQQRLV
jgi:hypothetical protein